MKMEGALIPAEEGREKEKRKRGSRGCRVPQRTPFIYPFRREVCVCL